MHNHARASVKCNQRPKMLRTLPPDDEKLDARRMTNTLEPEIAILIPAIWLGGSSSPTDVLFLRTPDFEILNLPKTDS
jgi:hypothetical protein